MEYGIRSTMNVLDPDPDSVPDQNPPLFNGKTLTFKQRSKYKLKTVNFLKGCPV